MTKNQYETIRTLVAEIESLKGMIGEITNLIQNETSGIKVTVKGQEILIPLALSPLRHIKKSWQDELDQKQLYFQNIVVTFPS